MNFREIPIFINSYNRLECLQQQVSWFLRSGYRNITIIDNASTFPPLLQYLKRISRHVAVIGLARNVGKFALWECGLVPSSSSFYAYTDPDVIPDDACPGDALALFSRVLERFPDYDKAGFGLRIDDLPDHYEPKPMVTKWEAQFWEKPLDSSGLPCDVYDAAIDTTFALYRHPKFSDRAIRTGFPYVARHYTWYLDSSHPTGARDYYEHSPRINGTWDMHGSRSPVVLDIMRGGHA